MSDLHKFINSIWFCECYVIGMFKIHNYRFNASRPQHNLNLVDTFHVNLKIQFCCHVITSCWHTWYKSRLSQKNNFPRCSSSLQLAEQHCVKQNTLMTLPLLDQMTFKNGITSAYGLHCLKHSRIWTYIWPVYSRLRIKCGNIQTSSTNLQIPAFSP